MDERGEYEEYLGLPVAEAGRLADDRGWRIVRVLEPGEMITLEYREGRLNLAARDGVVERCWEG
ncbi:I78 family peptidase inhibitor [Kitasatospora sp. NPDC056138]|uniref:I78 family peptidase inhibitor n=1 Tax=Kitasatospora sp. NPDC056138 TaxID=3345724 RepID=UPI0035D9D1B9